MCIFFGQKIKGRKIKTRFFGAENEKENEIRSASIHQCSMQCTDSNYFKVKCVLHDSAKYGSIFSIRSNGMPILIIYRYSITAHFKF